MRDKIKYFGVFFLLVACAPAMDLTPPKFILGPVTAVYDTSVTIGFVTNEPANAVVHYGADTTYGFSVLDNHYVTDHSVIVRNLEEKTIYHLKIESYDSLGNGPTQSADFTINTLEYQPPPPVVVSEVLANALAESSGEFVELVNTGSEPVSVSGWTISDNDATDSLVPFIAQGGGTLDIPAGGYALILDPNYGDGEEDYDFPEGTVLLTVEDTTLGTGLANTSDTITIHTNEGKEVSTYGTPGDPNDGIPSDPGNGKSMERCVLSDPDEVSNWKAATDVSGHTAGKANTSDNCP